MNPRATPRKNTGLTDTLAKRLTEWLTFRRSLRILAGMWVIHAHIGSWSVQDFGRSWSPGGSQRAPAGFSCDWATGNVAPPERCVPNALVGQHVRTFLGAEPCGLQLRRTRPGRPIQGWHGTNRARAAPAARGSLRIGRAMYSGPRRPLGCDPRTAIYQRGVQMKISIAKVSSEQLDEARGCNCGSSCGGGGGGGNCSNSGGSSMCGFAPTSATTDAHRAEDLASPLR